MSLHRCLQLNGPLLLAIALLVVIIVYWSGLSGGWLFDDYPNIVDNHGVQPADAGVIPLLRAMLSSPASEFKRPLASLSFALNYLGAGLDPYWWKLTNLCIHLLNGVLVFLLARTLIRVAAAPRVSPSLPVAGAEDDRAGWLAALIAAGWMLLPINLTSVLYVVQRMESLANVFVLLGLLGYLAGRQRMLAPQATTASVRRGLWLCVASLILPSAVGALAKETAVMLPLYALLIEWALFRFRDAGARRDLRILGLFLCVLVLPILLGLAWLLPGLLLPATWATRNFTLGTRLLSETRIVLDYIGWTLWPTAHALSFYHEDFRISSGLLSPWTTLTSIVALLALLALLPWLRRRQPLAALGIALYFGCHLLTATILPLELIYEHRNYFASFGLLLAIVPLLVPMPAALLQAQRPPRLRWLRYGVLAVLLIWWTTQTALTAYAWGDNLRLAQTLAERAPASPRAQYELGRTYIIYSHNDPASPYTRLAYAPLEHAAALPDSSVLPQQALIFMNARMDLPLHDSWWDSMIAKLKSRPTGVQDDSSLGVLAQCARDGNCDLPKERMTQVFEAAIDHPLPSPRALATYGGYAWSVLDDRELGERMTARAVQADPREPVYRISMIRMLIAMGRRDEAAAALKPLEAMNIGGVLDGSVAELRSGLTNMHASMPAPGSS